MYTEMSENPVVYLDLKFGKAKAGRIVIELFKNIVPKSVENFRALCTGERGFGRNGQPLCYKNTKIHRVVPHFLIQGGDITTRDGTGGESIYGECFEDENFQILHDKVGIVGFSNNGPNTNNSQFYITTVPCSHLDGLNVAFGIVRKGFNILLEMADLPRDNEAPIETVLIENCGEFSPNLPWFIGENDGTDDIYPPWPNDWDNNSNNNDMESAIVNIMNSGKLFHNNNNFIDAERKYIKSLRYIDKYLQDNDANNERILKLRLNALLNLATVRFKRNKFKDSVDLCNQVILKNRRNAKAYYRRAQAKLALQDYDKALSDLQTAQRLQPNDKNINRLLQTAKKYKLKYLEREKQIYSKFFQ